MHDAADSRELAVEQDVRRRVGRRLQLAFDDVAVQIDEHHVRRLELRVGNAARLDRDDAALPVDAARVAERQAHEATLDQLLIRRPHLVPQVGELHAAPPLSSRMAIKSFMT